MEIENILTNKIKVEQKNIKILIDYIVKHKLDENKGENNNFRKNNKKNDEINDNINKSFDL